MAREAKVRCANVFHAGDGNLHPLILFDANEPDELRRAEAFGAEILELSVAMGGTISGEHGIGYVKAPYLNYAVDRPTLEIMKGIKKVFDPNGILNPGKMFD